MEGGMSYVGTMVCRHDEKGRICLLLSRGLFTTGRFSGRFFRLPELQLFVPCTDSALIIFYLKCHLKKKKKELI